MTNPAFDRKFGPQFIDSVPRAPGVYRYLDGAGAVVYVGKAADLRARLGQYRNARRTKADRKMRRIVRDSARIELEVTASERAALLLESELIRTLRPPLNVVGAFSFLYPALGLKREEGHLHIVHSTHPELLAERGFELFGCYRNRRATRAGFDALVSVLDWLGHRERAPERLPHTTWRRFRQVPSELDAGLSELLRGRSAGFLEDAVLALVEKPSARRDSAEVQKQLRALRRFHGSECKRLGRLLAAEDVAYIPQEARDDADIRAGFPVEAEEA